MAGFGERLGPAGEQSHARFVILDFLRDSDCHIFTAHNGLTPVRYFLTAHNGLTPVRLLRIGFFKRPIGNRRGTDRRCAKGRQVCSELMRLVCTQGDCNRHGTGANGQG